MHASVYDNEDEEKNIATNRGTLNATHQWRGVPLGSIE